ncbi:MAG: YHS domain-containing protein [Candidatus Dormibacteria bacterium]
MPELTFAFVDLAGFTALTEAHGDEDAADLVERFVEITTSSLAPEDQLVKCVGDAVMLTSLKPGAGVALMRRLYEGFRMETNFPLPRAGLHHGPAVERGGDFFGSTVNVAARVAAHASAGQVLATPQVASAARQLGVGMVELGLVRLRNVEEPCELSELQIGEPDQAYSVDPVCRMRVQHDVAAGQLVHGGHRFWFCSMSCASKFSADPDRYAGMA